MRNIQQNIHKFSQNHPILPIVDVSHASDIVPIIEALTAGNIHAVEITLRSPAAMEAIALARKTFPDYCICVGTVTQTQQLEALKDLSINFFVTPGINKDLLNCCEKNQLNILPGVTTASDILLGIQYELEFFKFFPAEAMGGTKVLNAFKGPFSQNKFCATGGINENNFLNYLSLDNTFCVAGSWLASKEVIQEKNWSAITQRSISTGKKLKQFQKNCL